MSDESLAISAGRLERLIDVLSLLSLGEYGPAQAHLEVSPAEDRFSVLEQALSLFVGELAEAREENLAYVSMLEDSKRDIEQKLETINQQQLVIRELSTPIIELWDEVLTLPIVGVVDSQRALEMTDQLLQRISDDGVRCVIIDVTGIDMIDTMTANHFMQMIRAAQLLGVYCVVTGMSPRIATTMVGLGIDFSTVQTLRSLKQGLEHCVSYLRGRQQDRSAAWKR